MNKLNKISIAVAAAAIVLPGITQATTLAGVTFAPGDTLVIGTIYEGRVDGPNPYLDPIDGAGQELGGVGKVDAIKDANGVTVWQDGNNNTELTFQFGGFISDAPTGTGPISINFSGGFANFFAGTPPDFVTSPIAAMLAAASNGTPWLNLVGGSTGVACTSGDCTLQSVILNGTLAAINSGVGNGFLDVTAGSGVANSSFNTNSAGAGHDFQLGSSFTSTIATGAMFASGSMNLKSSAVPEPSTLALLGLGLIGFAMNSRRRQSN